MDRPTVDVLFVAIMSIIFFSSSCLAMEVTPHSVDTDLMKRYMRTSMHHFCWYYGGISAVQEGIASYSDVKNSDLPLRMIHQLYAKNANESAVNVKRVIDDAKKEKIALFWPVFNDSKFVMGLLAKQGLVSQPIVFLIFSGKSADLSQKKSSVHVLKISRGDQTVAEGFFVCHNDFAEIEIRTEHQIYMPQLLKELLEKAQQSSMLPVIMTAPESCYLESLAKSFGFKQLGVMNIYSSP